MGFLAQNRDTDIRGQDPIWFGKQRPVAAGVHIYAGARVSLVGGFVVPGGSVGLAEIAGGRAEAEANNSTGLAGALLVMVRQGNFPWDSAGGVDAISLANVGAPCFGVDDHTVALTDGNGTRSFAGTIVDVDSYGVWVQTWMGQRPPAAVAGNIVSAPVDLPAYTGPAAADVISPITPGFSGRIRSVFAIVNVPETNANKAVNLQARISGVAIGGGLVALTSANMAAAGGVIGGSAVVAPNTFGPADTIDVQASLPNGGAAFPVGTVAVMIALA